MARDRNEMGGQSAGQGEATGKRAAEGDRDEQKQVRRRKLAVRDRGAKVGETPRPPRFRNNAG